MSYRAPKSLKKKMIVINLGKDNSFIIYDDSSLTMIVPTYIHPIQKKNKEKKRKEIMKLLNKSSVELSSYLPFQYSMNKYIALRTITSYLEQVSSLHEAARRY